MATAQNKKLATAVAATISGPILTLKFSHGQTLTVDANALTPDIQQQAMMHGLKQKLIDAAAIARDPETGRTATIEDKFSAVLDVYNRITAAEGSTWNKARVAGDGNGNKGGMLLRAVMKLTSKSRTEAIEWLDKRSKEEVASLRKNPRIVEIMAQLQVEAANTNGVDSDSLLEGFMHGGGNDLTGDHNDTDADTSGDDDTEIPGEHALEPETEMDSESDSEADVPAIDLPAEKASKEKQAAAANGKGKGGKK